MVYELVAPVVQAGQNGSHVLYYIACCSVVTYIGGMVMENIGILASEAAQMAICGFISHIIANAQNLLAFLPAWLQEANLTDILHVYQYLTPYIKSTMLIFQLFGQLVQLLLNIEADFYPQAERLHEVLLDILKQLFVVYRGLEDRLDIPLADSPIGLQDWETD